MPKNAEPYRGPDAPPTWLRSCIAHSLRASAVVLGAIEENTADTLLAFYDLGSAKLNLELACETCTKKVLMQPVPIVEGTFAAAVLLQAGAALSEVLDELEPLKITK